MEKTAPEAEGRGDELSAPELREEAGEKVINRETSSFVNAQRIVRHIEERQEGEEPDERGEEG